MKSAVILLVISVSALPLFSQSALHPDAYEVTRIAGVETTYLLKDGIGEEANFVRPTALWGDVSIYTLRTDRRCAGSKSPHDA